MPPKLSKKCYCLNVKTLIGHKLDGICVVITYLTISFKLYIMLTYMYLFHEPKSEEEK